MDQKDAPTNNQMRVGVKERVRRQQEYLDQGRARASKYEEAGKYAEAEKIYRVLLELHPECVPLYAALCQAALLSGRRLVALRVAREGQAKLNEFRGRKRLIAEVRSVLLHSEGSALLDLRRYREAADRFRESQKLLLHSSTSMELGNALVLDGHCDEGERVYRRALDKVGHSRIGAGLYNNLALLELNHREGFEKSLAILLEGRDAYPDEPVAAVNLARGLVQRGRYDEAIVQLDRFRDHKTARRLLTKIARVREDISEPVGRITSSAWDRLGQRYNRAGQYVNAVKAYLQATAGDCRSLPLVFRATKVFVENDFKIAAVHALRKAMAFHPEDAALWSYLAFVYATLGNDGSALMAMTMALGILSKPEGTIKEVVAFSLPKLLNAALESRHWETVLKVADLYVRFEEWRCSSASASTRFATTADHSQYLLPGSVFAAQMLGGEVGDSEMVIEQAGVLVLQARIYELAVSKLDGGRKRFPQKIVENLFLDYPEAEVAVMEGVKEAERKLVASGEWSGERVADASEDEVLMSATLETVHGTVVAYGRDCVEAYKTLHYAWTVFSQAAGVQPTLIDYHRVSIEFASIRVKQILRRDRIVPGAAFVDGRELVTNALAHVPPVLHQVNRQGQIYFLHKKNDGSPTFSMSLFGELLNELPEGQEIHEVGNGMVFLRPVRELKITDEERVLISKTLEANFEGGSYLMDAYDKRVDVYLSEREIGKNTDFSKIRYIPSFRLELNKQLPSRRRFVLKVRADGDRWVNFGTPSESVGELEKLVVRVPLLAEAHPNRLSFPRVVGN